MKTVKKVLKKLVNIYIEGCNQMYGGGYYVHL